MATAPLLCKTGPRVLDQTAVLKTNRQAKRSAAAFRVSFDTPTRAVADLVLVQSLSKTDPVSYRQRQCRFVALAINRRQIDVFAPNETFAAENVAREEIESDGIAIPAGHDKNVVAISLSKIPPSLDGAGLRCLAAGDEINPAVLGVNSQACL